MVWKRSKGGIKFLAFAIGFVLLVSGSCDQQHRRRISQEDTVVYNENDSANIYQEAYQNTRLDSLKLGKKEFDKISQGEKYIEDEKIEKAPKTNRDFKMPKAPNPGSFGFMSILGYVAIGLLIAGLIYLIIQNSSGNRNLNNKNQNISTGNALDPEFLKKLETKKYLEQYLLDKDYRMAVRMLYLQLIQRLSNAGLVLPSIEKTNLDFYMELGGNSIQSDFKKVTGIYERAWYADADIDATTFERIRPMFEQIIGRVNG